MVAIYYDPNWQPLQWLGEKLDVGYGVRSVHVYSSNRNCSFHFHTNAHHASSLECTSVMLRPNSQPPDGMEAGQPVSKLANFLNINVWYESLNAGRLHVLLFCSCIMSFRFEVYISAKFLTTSDGKRGTGGLLHASFVGRVKVIKHGSYFRLDIRSWLRIRDSCLGLWMLHASFWV